LPGQAHGAARGCITAGDQRQHAVLLPEPEAPTMAAVSRGARQKSTSRKMSSVPLESVTDLLRCSTATMGSALGLVAWGEGGEKGAAWVMKS